MTPDPTSEPSGLAPCPEASTPSDRPLAGFETGLAIFGILWGLALASLFARYPAGTGGAAAALARASLALLLGLAHGAALALAARAAGRTRAARRAPRALATALAVAVGLLYAPGVLSLLKFRVVGAHLRFEDLWFVGRSLGQLGAEVTARERAGLAFALLLPVGLAALVLGLARLTRNRRAPSTASLVALLALTGLGGALATRTHPGAREAATVLFPDARLMTALFGGGAPQASDGADGPAGPAIRPYAAGPGARRWDVLVLMLESIPWKRLHGPEARPEATPRLEELAREGVVFDRAYATSTHSDYAQTSILASLHPRKYPGHDYFRALDYPRTLFWDPLAGLGYRTAVFSCQNENWGNMIAFLRTPSLQLLRHAPDWPEAPHRGDGSESKVFEETPVTAFFDWLDREPERPFAVYLNFQATHYPYVVPAGFAGPYGPAEIDFPTTFLSYPREKIPVMLDRFHNALAYVDSQVGAVVDGLAARGRLATTALLVVSDHGEAFYEHGLPTHGTTLLEEQARTAMLLRLPGAAPRRVAAPVSVLDGVPLIYRALGLPRHGNFQGRDDVLEAGYSGAGRAIPMTIQGMTREDGLVSGDWKYLVNWDRRERALFDLASDPEERRNLAAAAPLELERLDRELRLLLERQLGYYAARGWERGRYPPPLP